MNTRQRIVESVRNVMPGTIRICIWMIKITVGISFAMMLLKYLNILPWISDFIGPVFKYFGLPGSAALAYLSGYFVNVYSAIAVITSIGLDWRATTIMATMVLCSHTMVLETAILKKTGASAVRMVIIRTLEARRQTAGHSHLHKPQQRRRPNDNVGLRRNLVDNAHNTAGCSHRSGMGNKAGDTAPEGMNQAPFLSYRYPAIIAAESPTSCSQGRFL